MAKFRMVRVDFWRNPVVLEEMSDPLLGDLCDRLKELTQFLLDKMQHFFPVKGVCMMVLTIMQLLFVSTVSILKKI
jgi:hypothetical protein